MRLPLAPAQLSVREWVSPGILLESAQLPLAALLIQHILSIALRLFTEIVVPLVVMMFVYVSAIAEIRLS